MRRSMAGVAVDLLGFEQTRQTIGQIEVVQFGCGILCGAGTSLKF